MIGCGENPAIRPRSGGSCTTTSIRRSRRRTCATSSGSRSMRPQAGAGMTTSACSPTLTSAVACPSWRAEDHQTVRAFSLFLQTHGGEVGQISEVCQDMSQAFEKGVRENLPDAEITFDRYHVKAQLSQAVDEVRREESKHHTDLLKNTRYMWLKRSANLTDNQRDLLDELLAQPLATVRAYTLAQQFDSFYELDDPTTAEEYLRRWITEVDRSELEPVQKFVRMLEDRWAGVLRWHHSRLSNGLMEALNSLIQAAKRRARGYRTNRNFIAMIYLIVGKLNAGPIIT
jgi:transposase